MDYLFGNGTLEALAKSTKEELDEFWFVFRTNWETLMAFVPEMVAPYHLGAKTYQLSYWYLYDPREDDYKEELHMTRGMLQRKHEKPQHWNEFWRPTHNLLHAVASIRLFTHP